MNISDIGSNVLIGIVSGIVSSIIVTRIFMLIQSYLDEFRQIRIVALKIYRADVYLRMIISQASKYVSYEKFLLSINRLVETEKKSKLTIKSTNSISHNMFK